MVVAVAIALISMLLMGCDLLDRFLAFTEDDYYAPPAEEQPAKADSSAPYYDTEDGADTAGAESAAAPIFDNQNILAVQNGGDSPTFEVPATVTITKITTYHWNDASGNSSTGTISLRANNGRTYGPWETVGSDGQGGVPNAYWAATPNATLPAGSYTVIDSDPSTWSQNADSGGEGFVSVLGVYTP